MKVLTESDMDSFITDGFIHCNEVFTKKDALAMQDEIWEELNEEFSINRKDPRSWRFPPHSPRKAKNSKLNEKVISGKFRHIIDDLLGNGNWKEPNSWGGILITFPTVDQKEWNLTHTLWHWDYEFFRMFELKGLLIFSFYSDVMTQGGGTLLVKGSHRLLENYYHTLTPKQQKLSHGAQRKHFMKWHPWFQNLSNPNASVPDRKKYFMEQSTIIDGIHVQVVELIGKPGDVVFCHPRIIHASADINLRDHPRIMRVKFLW